MAYIKFLDSNNLIKCTVIPADHIVTVKFDDVIVVDTSGFMLFLDQKGDVDIGGNSYIDYHTIYRNDAETSKYNGYQLSNDGSVYTEPEPLPEPEPIPPHIPSINELVDLKVKEMNVIQQSAITNGVDVMLSDGNTEHFTLSEHDQTSLMGLQAQVLTGNQCIPWHTSDEGEHCKFYSNSDMAKIVETAMQFVTYHVTYFRDLRIYIRSLESREEIINVTYGMPIPLKFQSEPLKALLTGGQI